MHKIGRNLLTFRNICWKASRASWASRCLYKGYNLTLKSKACIVFSPSETYNIHVQSVHNYFEFKCNVYRISLNMQKKKKKLQPGADYRFLPGGIIDLVICVVWHSIFCENKQTGTKWWYLSICSSRLHLARIREIYVLCMKLFHASYAYPRQGGLV